MDKPIQAIFLGDHENLLSSAATHTILSTVDLNTIILELQS